MSHGWFRLAPFRWSNSEAILQRAELIGDQSVDLEISLRKGILRIAGAKATDDLLPILSRMFQLHLDIAPFLALARQSPTHGWVGQSGFGRLLCGSTLFEDVVK